METKDSKITTVEMVAFMDKAFELIVDEIVTKVRLELDKTEERIMKWDTDKFNINSRTDDRAAKQFEEQLAAFENRITNRLNRAEISILAKSAGVTMPDTRIPIMVTRARPPVPSAPASPAAPVDPTDLTGSEFIESENNRDYKQALEAVIKNQFASRLGWWSSEKYIQDKYICMKNGEIMLADERESENAIRTYQIWVPTEADKLMSDWVTFYVNKERKQPAMPPHRPSPVNPVVPIEIVETKYNRNCSHALESLKINHFAARAAWRSKEGHIQDKYLCMKNGEIVLSNKQISEVSRSYRLWSPGQADMKANDWITFYISKEREQNAD